MNLSPRPEEGPSKTAPLHALARRVDRLHALGDLFAVQSSPDSLSRGNLANAARPASATAAALSGGGLSAVRKLQPVKPRPNTAARPSSAARTRRGETLQNAIAEAATSGVSAAKQKLVADEHRLEAAVRAKHRELHRRLGLSRGDTVDTAAAAESPRAALDALDVDGLDLCGSDADGERFAATVRALHTELQRHGEVDQRMLEADVAWMKLIALASGHRTKRARLDPDERRLLVPQLHDLMRAAGAATAIVLVALDEHREATVGGGAGEASPGSARTAGPSPHSSATTAPATPGRSRAVVVHYRMLPRRLNMLRRADPSVCATVPEYAADEEETLPLDLKRSGINDPSGVAVHLLRLLRLLQQRPIDDFVDPSALTTPLLRAKEAKEAKAGSVTSASPRGDALPSAASPAPLPPLRAGSAAKRRSTSQPSPSPGPATMPAVPGPQLRPASPKRKGPGVTQRTWFRAVDIWAALFVQPVVDPPPTILPAAARLITPEALALAEIEARRAADPDWVARQLQLPPVATAATPTPLTPLSAQPPDGSATPLVPTPTQAMELDPGIGSAAGPVTPMRPSPSATPTRAAALGTLPELGAHTPSRSTRSALAPTLSAHSLTSVPASPVRPVRASPHRGSSARHRKRKPKPMPQPRAVAVLQRFARRVAARAAAHHRHELTIAVGAAAVNPVPEAEPSPSPAEPVGLASEDDSDATRDARQAEAIQAMAVLEAARRDTAAGHIQMAWRRFAARAPDVRERCVLLRRRRERRAVMLISQWWAGLPDRRDQRHFRHFWARLQYRRREAALRAFENLCRSVAQLQRVGRGFRLRATVAHDTQAAFLAAAIAHPSVRLAVRQLTARRHAARLAAERQQRRAAEYAVSVRYCAATHIQRAVRGHLARRRVQALHRQQLFDCTHVERRSIAVLARAVVMFASLGLAATAKAERSERLARQHLEELRHSAARKLQAFFMMVAQRSKFRRQVQLACALAGVDGTSTKTKRRGKVPKRRFKVALAHLSDGYVADLCSVGWDSGAIANDGATSAVLMAKRFIPSYGKLDRSAIPLLSLGGALAQLNTSHAPPHQAYSMSKQLTGAPLPRHARKSVILSMSQVEMQSPPHAPPVKTKHDELSEAATREEPNGFEDHPSLPLLVAPGEGQPATSFDAFVEAVCRTPPVTLFPIVIRVCLPAPQWYGSIDAAPVRQSTALCRAVANPDLFPTDGAPAVDPGVDVGAPLTLLEHRVERRWLRHPYRQWNNARLFMQAAVARGVAWLAAQCDESAARGLDNAAAGPQVLRWVADALGADSREALLVLLTGNLDFLVAPDVPIEAIDAMCVAGEVAYEAFVPARVLVAGCMALLCELSDAELRRYATHSLAWLFATDDLPDLDPSMDRTRPEASSVDFLHPRFSLTAKGVDAAVAAARRQSLNRHGSVAEAKLTQDTGAAEERDDGTEKSAEAQLSPASPAVSEVRAPEAPEEHPSGTASSVGTEEAETSSGGSLPFPADHADDQRHDGTPFGHFINAVRQLFAHPLIARWTSVSPGGEPGASPDLPVPADLHPGSAGGTDPSPTSPEAPSVIFSPRNAHLLATEQGMREALLDGTLLKTSDDCVAVLVALLIGRPLWDVLRSAPGFDFGSDSAVAAGLCSGGSRRDERCESRAGQYEDGDGTDAGEDRDLCEASDAHSSADHGPAEDCSELHVSAIGPEEHDA